MNIYTCTAVCAHAYTYRHVHMCTVYTCMCTHTAISMHMRAYTHACTHMRTHTDTAPSSPGTRAVSCLGLLWAFLDHLLCSRVLQGPLVSSPWSLQSGSGETWPSQSKQAQLEPGAQTLPCRLQGGSRAWTPSQQDHWRAAHLLQLTGHTLPLGSWVPATCHLRSPNHCLAVMSFLPKHHCGKLQGSHGVDYVAIPTEGQIDSSQLPPVSTHNTMINTTPVVVPEDEVAELQQGQDQSKAPEWE